MFAVRYTKFNKLNGNCKRVESAKTYRTKRDALAHLYGNGFEQLSASMPDKFKTCKLPDVLYNDSMHCEAHICKQEVSK